MSHVAAIDKNKYRWVKEALLHLVRNSVAHGLETPEERAVTGKKGKGRIRIEISRQGAGIVIRYADDGKGLDLDRIREKAVENGLLSLDEAKSVDASRVVRYIFDDGFSTTDEADMVSGVGAGMAVVRRNVTEKLGGKVKFGSKTGDGVRFVLALP